MNALVLGFAASGLVLTGFFVAVAFKTDKPLVAALEAILATFFAFVLAYGFAKVLGT